MKDPENDDGIASFAIAVEHEIGVNHHNPYASAGRGPGRSTLRMIDETIEHFLEPVLVIGRSLRAGLYAEEAQDPDKFSLRAL